MPRISDPPQNPPQMVKVIRTDEKGSNVNLASYLAAFGRYYPQPFLGSPCSLGSP
jgi:hypothetical protein